MSLVLAFYKGRRSENPDAALFDRLVCAWPRSRGRFSHVEIVTDHAAGGYALCWASSPRDGGVRPQYIHVDSGRWVLVTLPYHDGQFAVEWIAARCGWRYDWPGVLGFVFPLIKQKLQWLFCSEAAAGAIEAGAGWIDRARLVEWPPSAAISPSALFEWAAAQPGAHVVEQRSDIALVVNAAGLAQQGS